MRMQAIPSGSRRRRRAEPDQPAIAAVPKVRRSIAILAPRVRPYRVWRRLLPVIVGVALSGCGSSSVQHLSLAGTQYRFDGWGVSLAWWANVIGASGWRQGSNDPRTQVLRALFGDPRQPSGGAWGPEIHPLGLNILRYNIGASQVGAAAGAPSQSCGANRFRPGASVPSPMQSQGGGVDLGLDARQIDVLSEAKQMINSANGPPSILEAFANSPPWWLTSNRCPAGQPPVAAAPEPGPYPGSAPPPHFYPYNPFVLGVGSVDATRAKAADYARYLLDVVAAFHRRTGIDFATLEAFNEPNEPNGGFWKGCGPNCQEGSNFSPDAQTAVVDALCSDLNDPAYADLRTTISANDENSLHQLLPALPSWKGSGCLSQVNVHGYNGLDQRAELAQAAADRSVWMSEYGDGSCGATVGTPSDFCAKKPGPEPCSDHVGEAGCSALTLAEQVTGDLQDLRPRAWVYWQALEANGGWGLLADNSTTPLSMAGPTGPMKVTARYWALAQFSSYIRGGATIYPLALDKNAYSRRDNSRDNAETLASQGTPLEVVARNPDGRVVVVLTNPTQQSQDLSLSLAPLSVAGPVEIHQLQLDDRDANPASAPPDSDLPPPTELRSQTDLRSSHLVVTPPRDTITTYVIGSQGGANPVSGTTTGCSKPLSAAQAAAVVHSQPGPFPGEAAPLGGLLWVPDTSAYDPSLDLSTVRGDTPGGTVSSPVQVFMFHKGCYEGPALPHAYGEVKIAQVSNDAVAVHYAHFRPTDGNCCPSLPDYVVRFHWNGTKVVALDPAPPHGQGGLA